MPADLCAALRDDAGLLRLESHCGCSRVFEAPRVVEVQLVHRVAEFRHVDREVRNPVEQAEEDRRNGDVEPRDVGAGQPAEPQPIRVVHQHVQSRQRQIAAVGTAFRGIEPRRVAPLRVSRGRTDCLQIRV